MLPYCLNNNTFVSAFVIVFYWKESNFSIIIKLPHTVIPNLFRCAVPAYPITQPSYKYLTAKAEKQSIKSRLS